MGPPSFLHPRGRPMTAPRQGAGQFALVNEPHPVRGADAALEPPGGRGGGRPPSSTGGSAAPRPRPPPTGALPCWTRTATAVWRSSICPPPRRNGARPVRGVTAGDGRSRRGKLKCDCNLRRLTPLGTQRLSIPVARPHEPEPRPDPPPKGPAAPGDLRPRGARP